MTNITYATTENEFSLECRGHAGYACAGQDIVCAAISVLAETLAMYLCDQKDEVVVRVESGYLYIHSKGEKSIDAFNQTLTGLKSVEANYPQYLSIEKGCTIFGESCMK